MNVKTIPAMPQCPICKATLLINEQSTHLTGDLNQLGFETNGYCPICGKSYEWNQWYEAVGYEELK